jgi:uncharacterized linocin/CFP29 family protein
LDNRITLVGWSDDQWSRIRQAVSEEAHKARVAATFLPPYGPLPPSTQVVPSELFVPNTGEVNDVFTAPLVEIYEEVVLSRQQVNEEELSSTLLAFRRAANDVARVEDRIIFNGQFEYNSPTGTPVRTLSRIAGKHEYERVPPTGVSPAGMNVYDRVKVKDGDIADDYETRFFQNHVSTTFPTVSSAAATAAVVRLGDNFHYERLKATNPGGLGLMYGADLSVPKIPLALDRRDQMVQDFVNAVNNLEAEGHLAPFVCVLGSAAFQATHRPEPATFVLPSDQIEPILGSQILRSSAIPGDRGVLIALAGDPIDLAVAVDASPQFLNITEEGKYRFRVVERFALRVKEPKAIVRLEFI